ncbi:MAG: tRNA uridine-5-carboxymethylaminomethyl(34) synthesis GTPase MnmE [Betaproteobacteria bacterium RIFCSPLOWO2_02_FULL_67_26]|nr:MAG: tRNA uridine-5-carboxymethylaminomethyl(34) synthesis GTPase MnmE [Betaproteobacteria bacterium RIFCSPLOWO2_02_FULL_67_26]
MIDRDTIAAIATAAGRSGIGVVRVSGQRLEPMVRAIIGRPPAPRQAVLADFLDARGGVIDQGIALFFPAPRSYTGEDVLELQGHGGPVVLRELLKRCLELGARPARPGEFTERAYLNDKLDLAQAESVADLIDAATREAARSAVRSLQGVFSQRVEELTRAVIELRALVEATLDFPDEEVEFLKQADADGKLAAASARLEDVLSASRQGSLLRDGIHVVLAGQPNVGKSSLLNCLAGEDLAIVTEIPGTTRDVIRQSINLEGVPAHVIDTAGLRVSDDPVERIGIARTWAAIERADLVVLLLDATQGESAADRAILKQLPAELGCIRVMNKIDLVGRAPARELKNGATTIWLSAKTGAGMELLRHALLERVGWRSDGEGLFMARERHVQALQQASTHLKRARELGDQLELFAEELRLAQEALGAITGDYSSDDLLGEIFSRFCIGK